jgi:hypothetical protein
MTLRRVLNLGAGTQSSVLLLMADRGEVPPVEVAVFADTGWEPREVYEHLAWLEKQVRTPVVRVSGGDIRSDGLRSVVGGRRNGGERWASMPLVVKHDKGRVHGGGDTLFGTDDEWYTVDLKNPRIGRVRRQCTTEYKIQPISRWIKEHMLGLRPRQHWPSEPVIQRVFGISFDERQRMRDAAYMGEKWAVNEYPLVDRRLSRQHVIDMAAVMFPGRTFPRSACLGCPYRSNAEWRHLRDGDPAGWADAVDFDGRIRNLAGMRGKAYLHRSAVPLPQADIDDADGSPLLTGVAAEECEGMCGN